MTFVRPRVGVVALLALASIAMPRVGVAQAPEAPKVVTPLFDFSGLILGNFRYTYDDATKSANGGKAPNKFDIERVYLTFKMPAGEDGSIRVTTDVYNNTTAATNAYYPGWAIRLKYAYFQYNFLHDIGGAKGFNAVARVGMLHTALIDHEEGYWPRWISQTAVERNGFFSSSDVGIAGILTFPNKWGELYATVANGSGYGAAETDPYKDYSARLSLTPFGSASNMLKTFTISPYVYIGKTQSKYLTNASATADEQNGLKRNRDGVFVGLKDRRLTLGAEWGQRTEASEPGSGTVTAPATYENTGTLTSGFVIVRPFELFNDDPKAKSPFGILARVDNFKPLSNTAAIAAGSTQTTDAKNQLLIAGIFWDLNSKASFSIDYQDLKPQSTSTTVESKVLFAHMQVAF